MNTEYCQHYLKKLPATKLQYARMEKYSSCQLWLDRYLSIQCAHLSPSCSLFHYEPPESRLPSTYIMNNINVYHPHNQYYVLRISSLVSKYLWFAQKLMISFITYSSLTTFLIPFSGAGKCSLERMTIAPAHRDLQHFLVFYDLHWGWDGSEEVKKELKMR